MCTMTHYLIMKTSPVFCIFKRKNSQKSKPLKAILLKKFGGVENFALEEIENPPVGKDEVLIKIKATAFNPIDYQMRRGDAESKLLKSPILGRELSGEIVQVGTNIHSFSIGDKVAAYVGSLASSGTYASLISVPVELIAKIPPNITFEQAAAIPMVGMTALQCFNRVPVPKDSFVFIVGGAGGVGTILIKLLLAKGHKNLYTTAGNKESKTHLMQLGLPESHIVDYTKEDILSFLRKASGQDYFHFVFDLVGGNMSEIATELIEVFGTYVDVTFLTTAEAKTTLFDKAANVVHVANYAPALLYGKNQLSYYGTSLNDLFTKMKEQIITPSKIHIVGDLSVETVQKAHLLMENNQTKGKKLVMTVG